MRLLLIALYKYPYLLTYLLNCCDTIFTDFTEVSVIHVSTPQLDFKEEPSAEGGQHWILKYRQRSGSKIP